MPSVRWGDDDRHYGDTELPEITFRSEEAKYWEQLAKSLIPDARQQVERAVKTWNKPIRDQLRDEMGFRLSSGKKQVSVPVSVTNGMPILLQKKLADTEGALAELLIRRSLFQDAEEGVNSARALLGQITHVLVGADPGLEETESLKTVSELLCALNRALSQRPLPDLILELDEDVLGAYFFRIPRVHIFWLPIAILSTSARMPIEALTFVVLAHELAHAYSHLGFDIDGQAWETNDFANSGPQLVEGLAQYYAEMLCKRMKERLPAALECFNRMLEKQPAVYKAFRDWDQVGSGELMRAYLREVSDRNRSIPVGVDDDDLW